MSLRNDWQFDFTCGAVASAASFESERRDQRIEYWLNEREAIMQEIKDSGLEVEVFGQGMSKMSIESRAEVRIDAKLQERLAKCEEYLRKARQEKKQYEMFANVLSSQPAEKPIKLQPEDVFYFGLHKDPEPDFLSPEEETAKEEIA